MNGRLRVGMIISADSNQNQLSLTVCANDKLRMDCLSGHLIAFRLHVFENSYHRIRIRVLQIFLIIC